MNKNKNKILLIESLRFKKKKNKYFIDQIQKIRNKTLYNIMKQNGYFRNKKIMKNRKKV